MRVEVAIRRDEDRDWIITPIVISVLLHLILPCLIGFSGLFDISALKNTIDIRFNLREVPREVATEIYPPEVIPDAQIVVKPILTNVGGPMGETAKIGLVPMKLTPETSPPKGKWPQFQWPLVTSPGEAELQQDILRRGIDVPDLVGDPAKVVYPYGSARIVSLLPGPSEPGVLDIGNYDDQKKRASKAAEVEGKAVGGIEPPVMTESRYNAVSPKFKPTRGGPRVKLPADSLEPLPTMPKGPSISPYVDVKFATYKEPGDPQRYFRLEIRLKDNADPKDRLEVIAKDVLFVYDVSLSIKGDELAETRKAVETYLKALNKGDRFNAVRFSEGIYKLFPDFVSPTPDTITKTVAFCDRIPNETMTDVYSAIRTIVATIPRGDRPCNIFLVSDGASTMGIRSLQKIVNDFAAELRPEFSVFVFDAGKGGNTYLLDLLAYKSRGSFSHTDNRIGSAAELVRQFQTFNNPIFVKVIAKYAGLKVDEVYPEAMPNLYREHPIVIHGRCFPEDQIAIYLWGVAAGGIRTFEYHTELSKAESGDASIAREWARGKIHYLASQIARYGRRPEWLQQISRLSEKYGVTIPDYLR